MPPLKEASIRVKMMSFKVKITSYLKGKLKNAFMLDCIKRQTYEGDLIRQIVDLHYHIIEICPELKNKSFYEIKNLMKGKLGK